MIACSFLFGNQLVIQLSSKTYLSQTWTERLFLEETLLLEFTPSTSPQSLISFSRVLPEKISQLSFLQYIELSSDVLKWLVCQKGHQSSLPSNCSSSQLPSQACLFYHIFCWGFDMSCCSFRSNAHTLCRSEILSRSHLCLYLTRGSWKNLFKTLWRSLFLSYKLLLLECLIA